jgi:hypothetical protein
MSPYGTDIFIKARRASCASLPGATPHRKGQKQPALAHRTFDDIQELELSPDTLRILTYEDSRWELGRDREYLFDHRPSGFAKSVYVQCATGSIGVSSPIWRTTMSWRSW